MRVHLSISTRGTASADWAGSPGVCHCQRAFQAVVPLPDCWHTGCAHDEEDTWFPIQPRGGRVVSNPASTERYGIATKIKEQVNEWNTPKGFTTFGLNWKAASFGHSTLRANPPNTTQQLAPACQHCCPPPELCIRDCAARRMTALVDTPTSLPRTLSFSRALSLSPFSPSPP